MLSKIFNVPNEMNKHWKNIFRKIIFLDYGASTWIQSNFSGSFCKALFMPNPSFSSQIHHSLLSSNSEILRKIGFVFAQKFQTFQKVLNSFTCKW